MTEAAARIDLRLDPALARFRDEIPFVPPPDEMDTWTAPPAHADPVDLTGLDLEFESAHQRRAGELGYLGISVPTDLGGGGRPPSWKAIWMYEAGLPRRAG